jgi:hypothetical protein
LSSRVWVSIQIPSLIKYLVALWSPSSSIWSPISFLMYLIEQPDVAHLLFTGTVSYAL